MQVPKIWFLLLKCLIWGKRTQNKSNSVRSLFYYATFLPITCRLNATLSVNSTLFSSGVLQIRRVESHISQLKAHYHHWFMHNFFLVYLFIHAIIYFYYIIFSFPLLPIRNHSNVCNVCLSALINTYEICCWFECMCFQFI